jgi:hypothetical protein
MIDPDSELAVSTDPHIVKAMANIERICQGDQTTGVKGSKYWVERLEFYKNKLALIEEIYVGKLNEQRNSFTFILSIFTIVSWPFSFLTGYWYQITLLVLYYSFPSVYLKYNLLKKKN